MTPRIPDTPASSVRSTASVSVGPPALPPIPPIFYLTTMASSSDQHFKTVWDSVTPSPEDQPGMNSRFTETVSEEHPYSCIDNVRDSEPSSPSPCDEAEEEGESPYHTVTERTEPTATSDVTAFLPVTDGEKAEESKFPAVQDEQLLINNDRAAIYAVVNRTNKSQKSIKEAPAVRDATVSDEDEAPPVPKKTCD